MTFKNIYIDDEDNIYVMHGKSSSYYKIHDQYLNDIPLEYDKDYFLEQRKAELLVILQLMIEHIT